MPIPWGNFNNQKPGEEETAVLRRVRYPRFACAFSKTVYIPLIRFVAILLIPGLVAEPTTASAVGYFSAVSLARAKSISMTRMEEEAFSLRALPFGSRTYAPMEAAKTYRLESTPSILRNPKGLMHTVNVLRVIGKRLSQFDAWIGRPKIKWLPISLGLMARMPEGSGEKPQHAEARESPKGLRDRGLLEHLAPTFQSDIAPGRPYATGLLGIERERVAWHPETPITNVTQEKSLLAEAVTLAQQLSPQKPDAESLTRLEERLRALREHPLSTAGTNSYSMPFPQTRQRLEFPNLTKGRNYQIQPYWEPGFGLRIYFVHSEEVIGFAAEGFLSHLRRGKKRNYAQTKVREINL